ncbi:MAG: hypothetical protein GXN99_01780 [Candidatus Nanohaloarchaeota archaeon]|nr:hypothetical protein [Candidatus Nanohaloarchaeota archaeon]
MEEIINRGEISKLRREVLSKAELESEKLLEDAKQEMKDLRKKELNALKKELKEKIKDFTESEKKRAESDLRGKKQEIKAKYQHLKKELLDELVEESISRLIHANRRTKQKIYAQMIDYAVKELGGDIKELEVASQDYEIVKSLYPDAKIKKSKNLEFGIIAYGKDKGVVVNISLPHLKEELKEIILRKVVDKL